MVTGDAFIVCLTFHIIVHLAFVCLLFVVLVFSILLCINKSHNFHSHIYTIATVTYEKMKHKFKYKLPHILIIPGHMEYSFGLFYVDLNEKWTDRFYTKKFQLILAVKAIMLCCGIRIN